VAAFVFRAVDAAGRQQKGVLEASSAQSARRTLRERNLLPVSVEAGGGRALPSLNGQIDFGRLFKRRLGARGLADATRQLSTLISTDIRVEEALRIVANEAAATPAGPLLLEVRGAILEGRSFAAALAGRPDAFPEFYRASIAAGEHSGKLADVLAHLTEFVENQQRSRQKVQLALLYPALLATVSSGMITLLLIYVVPDIVKVFVSRGAQLPLLTRGLIALSDGVQHFGWLAALIVIGAIVGGRRWLKVPANRLTFGRLISSTPPFSRFSLQLNAARFAGSLATLVQSDVPLIDAIAAAAAVTPNPYIRERAQGVAARVREGSSLYQAMREAGCFPSMLLAIVASGESSGRLGPTLGRAAAELDRELEALIATLVALVEPGVLLLMGGIVLLLVLSILMPIINLSNLAGM
jgi:general secretion pathway protein F